jgi:hypothetical protein
MIAPIQTPITGNEDMGDLSSPFKALVQFYHAFNTGSLEEMSLNWVSSEDIVMDNPLGGIKRGWKEISSVYAKLFDGPAEVYVEYYDYTIHTHGEIFYTVGREKGFFQTGGERIDLLIRTSRIFRKFSHGWRQTHHHGSIEDAKLLADYQSAVMGKKVKYAFHQYPSAGEAGRRHSRPSIHVVRGTFIHRAQPAD